MSKTFKQIKQPNKLSKEIEKQIEDSIRNKILLPGDELPSENELCDIFGVSRTAIREAIHMLGTRGLVTTKRGKKTVINEYHEVLNISPIQFYLECNLSDKLIQDWINIRVSLEPTLARLAALNRTDDDLKILKKIINNLELKKNINNGKLLATLDKNFHSCIAAATQNPIIPLIMKPIYDMMPTIKSIIIKRVRHAKHANTEHWKIYKCIANRDADGAFLNMVEHMTSAAKHVYETRI